MSPRVILFLTSVFTFAAHASTPGSLDKEPVIDPIAAAAWLAAQPSAEHRAVGLLLGFAPRSETLPEPLIPAPPVRPEQIQSVLEASTSPAVLMLLTRVCGLSDQVEACRSIGLDQAIIDRDRGNVLARAIFLGDHVEGWQAAIEDHPFASDRSMEIARLVYLALDDFTAADPVDYSPAIVAMQAIILPGALASAAYSPLVDACEEAQAESLMACRQLARTMIDGSSSLMDLSIGAALMRTVAENKQSADQMAAWERTSSQLEDYSACLTQGIDENFYVQLDATDFRDWFDLVARQGELAGHEHWADQSDVDCSEARTALETARTEAGF